jgi:hypothetical protein
MSLIHTFLQLIWDADSENISNILIDRNWKVYKVDSSRAFRSDRRLEREQRLDRFSGRLLAGLESLTRERLDEIMEPWLDAKQIKCLWSRRNELLELAERRVADRGRAIVY